MDGYSWECRDRGRRRDHRGGPVPPMPVGGGYANPDSQDAGGSEAGGARLRHLPRRVLVGGGDRLGDHPRQRFDRGGLPRVSGGWSVPHRGEVRRTGAAVPRDRGARRADRLRERRGCSSVDELLVAETFYGGRG